jgi:hypothetical protein
MTRQASFRTALFAATAICGSGLATAPSRAADTSIGSIEDQIRHLQSQLARVKSDLAARHSETVRAQEAAHEAQIEAREANRRANAIAMSGTGQSFQGGAANGFGGGNGAYPGTFSAQDLPQNGIGPHTAASAGEQQASGLGQYGKFQLGGVTITLGGFIAAETVIRTRNIVADIGSSYNAIPYPQSATYHEPEFRGSARQSRLSLLIEGEPSTVARVAGYFETDFLSSGVSSNSNESNSYSLRVRQVYATYDRQDWGFHVLAGQAWSLLTLDRVGITPRQENIPLSIDAQYVVGFDWARQWQLRFVKDFNKKVWAGLSFEEPETVYSVTTQNVAGANNVGGVIGGVDNYANAGGSLLNSTANYSDDIAPDVVAKLAFDPGFGHYEVYGLGRIMNARDTLTAPAINSGRNRTALAGGGGGGMLLPVVGKKLVFQASALVGQGIGRYGSGQLPDATINQNGTPIPIPEVEVLAGLVYHPTKAFDLYAYAGAEQEAKRSFDDKIGGKTYAFGYGNGAFIDTGCELEGSAAACSGQTRGLVEGTLGGWWRFEHGTWGTLEAGTQWEYIRKEAFDGTSVAANGRTSVVSPKTDINEVLFSFRYLPFL